MTKKKIVAGWHCWRISRPEIAIEHTWLYRGWRCSYQYMPLWEAPDL